LSHLRADRCITTSICCSTLGSFLPPGGHLLAARDFAGRPGLPLDTDPSARAPEGALVVLPSPLPASKNSTAEDRPLNEQTQSYRACTHPDTYIIMLQHRVANHIFVPQTNIEQHFEATPLDGGSTTCCRTSPSCTNSQSDLQEGMRDFFYVFHKRIIPTPSVASAS
jgi:hypothetical protein